MTHIMTRDSSLGPQERGSGYRVQGREGVSVVCPKCGERHDFLGDDYRQWDATVLLPETLAYVGFPRSAQKLRNPDARDWLKVGALISEALKPLREVLEPMEGSMQVHIEKESFAFARSTAAEAHAAVRLGHDMESLSPDGDRTDAYSAVGWCRQAAFSSYMAFEAACDGKPAAQNTASWMDVILTGLGGLLAVGQEAKPLQGAGKLSLSPSARAGLLE